MYEMSPKDINKETSKQKHVGTSEQLQGFLLKMWILSTWTSINILLETLTYTPLVKCTIFLK